MALRALMKRRELDRVSAELKTLREAAEELQKREAELEKMIEEATTEEERAAVQEEVEKFEKEKAENEEQTGKLEETVRGIEQELDELEEADKAKAAKNQAPAPAPKTEERSKINMNTRSIFRKMDTQTRAALFAREDVKDFLGSVRSALGQKRAIEGAGLLIPEVFLGLIRENIENYSKMYKHVNVRAIGGTGKVVVMGTIPEAVWTDCCANLNELNLTFNDAEVDCWKVGGYFDICNATHEDSDIDLASEILTVLGQAIGYALDKAIVYGLGTRMPLGFFTRLAQTTKPTDYPATARPWVDLHQTNIITLEEFDPATGLPMDGVKLFAEIAKASGAAKGKYSRGEKVWVMNEATYTVLIAASMEVDSAGAIVSGVNGRMPVIGGIIEVLDFIPDNTILGGYFDLYLLAERAGTRLNQSEHVRFIEDRTVFKGTARYDGLPVIAEGFIAIGLNAVTPSASGITFAPDEANQKPASE